MWSSTRRSVPVSPQSCCPCPCTTTRARCNHLCPPVFGALVARLQWCVCARVDTWVAAQRSEGFRCHKCVPRSQPHTPRTGVIAFDTWRRLCEQPRGRALPVLWPAEAVVMWEESRFQGTRGALAAGTSPSCAGRGVDSSGSRPCPGIRAGRSSSVRGQRARCLPPAPCDATPRSGSTPASERTHPHSHTCTGR